MSKESGAIAPKTSPWKSLLGFLPESQALEMIRIPGVASDPKLEQTVRTAVEYVHRLERPPDSSPRLAEIPSGIFSEREGKLRGESTFAEHLAGINESQFQMVEISKLHVFQPNLNLEFVERLKERAPELGNTSELLKFCLPLRDEVTKRPVLAGFNPSMNTFTLASENLDLRIVGNVQGEDASTGRRFFGFAFGPGLPQMSVVKYKETYLLKNGYHRAYALLEKGHEFMPCLVVSTDNYQATGAVGPGAFPFEVVLAPKSPIMSDFFGEAAVIYPRLLIRVILTIHAEIQIASV